MDYTREFLEVIMIFSLSTAVLQYVLGSVLIVLAVLLVAMILFQSAKDRHLSGAIAGGTESFFGKSKAKATDRILSRLTIVFSSIFVVVAVALVIIINCIPS